MGPLPDPLRRRLPTSTKAVVGLLLAIPIVVPLLVFTYAKDGPRPWGFPFSYWYQLLCVLVAAGFTYAAYRVIERAQRGQR